MPRLETSSSLTAFTSARSRGRARSCKCGSNQGNEHYIVRWDDTGHESLFYPGPTSHALHTRTGSAEA